MFEIELFNHLIELSVIHSNTYNPLTLLTELFEIELRDHLTVCKQMTDV